MEMTPGQQQTFQRLYDRRKKSVLIAYFLWFVLFVHHGYLGKWPTQILFWITIGGLYVWWVIDAVRMQTLVNNYNDALEQKLKIGVLQGTSPR